MERNCMQKKTRAREPRKGTRAFLRYRDLPDDVFLNILIRLPIKSIIRFRSVSREFLHILSNKTFVKIHLEFSQNPTSLMLKRQMFFQKCPSLQVVSLGYRDRDFVKHDCPVLSYHPNAEMLASCHGLILICTAYRYYFLWNPTTRIQNVIASPDMGSHSTELPYIFFRLFGLGYDSAAATYKVVRAVRVHGNRARVSVYNTKTMVWKTISKFGYFIIHVNGQGVNVNDSPHWIVVRAPPECFFDYYGDLSTGEVVMEDGTRVRNYTIIYFNWQTEKFSEIATPAGNWFKNDSLFDLGKLKGMLCLAKHNASSTEVWVMKEYNVKESWTRLFVIPTIDVVDDFMPLCMDGDEMLIEDRKHKLSVYNVSSATAHEIIKFRRPCYENKFKTISYEETFVQVP